MGWEVEIRVDGESILTIGDWGVAGVVEAELDKHADRIRACSEHLRAFIGTEPTPCFGCGDAEWIGEEPCPICNGGAELSGSADRTILPGRDQGAEGDGPDLTQNSEQSQ